MLPRQKYYQNFHCKIPYILIKYLYVQYYISGFFPPFNSAKDSISTVYEKPAVQYPAYQSKSLPILSIKEMYSRRNES